MKKCRIGSSIKVILNNKEQFLTVDISGGDIILHIKGRVIARREINNNTFEYCGSTYSFSY